MSKFIWEGKGEAFEFLGVHSEEGKFFGTSLNPKLPYVKEDVYLLSADTLVDAIDELNRHDSELYWSMTAYADEG